MSLGVTVRTRTAPPSGGAPTNTGTWFLAGKASTVPSPNVAVKCRSIQDFIGAFGVRAAGNQVFYDEVDTFFREGGTVCYCAGYTAGSGVYEVDSLAFTGATAGSSPVSFVWQGVQYTTAPINYNQSNATLQAALLAATGPLGQTIPAGTITVSSGPLPAAATITFSGAVSGPVTGQTVLSPSSLTGGTVSYTTTTAGTFGGIDGALAMFTRDLGPGQVSAPEETPGTATYQKLYDHALNNNRFAIGDGTSTATVSSLITLGNQIPTGEADYGMVVGQYVTVPGPAGVIGAGPRTVAGSAVAAALCARCDTLGNPNRAAAGRDFPLQYTTGFALTVNDTDRNTLLNVGVNTFALVYGVLELYGFQTGVAQSDTTPFWQANCSRARMFIVAQAQSLGENYMFRPIDGQGRLAGQLKSDLDAMLLALYQANGLFGPTPQDAFATEVGAAVNTVATIAQGELHAACEARLSLSAKAVIIDLVSVPVSGRV